jgi:hypothetical protein
MLSLRTEFAHDIAGNTLIAVNAVNAGIARDRR